jgi:hypothetical protein
MCHLAASSSLAFVMAGRDPAIHVFVAAKTWMPGTGPGMTPHVSAGGEQQPRVRHGRT